MSNLVIDKKFFRDKTKNEVLPEHLDSQFNLIATYINETLIPFIESVIFNVTGGIAGHPSSVFCNINNNEIGYMYINDINVDDNLLSLNKIAKIPAGSVLASDYQGDIFAATPDDNDQLLFSNFLSSMSFRKITSDDIDNNVLSAKQLSVLAAENFTADSFVDIIKDGSIYEHMLQDVSNEKIAPGVVDFKHIGEFYELPYSPEIAAQVLLKDFDDSSIIVNVTTKAGTITPVNFVDPQFIEGKNIFPGSITDSHLKAYNANTQAPNVINLPNLIDSNFGAIINFPDQGINVHNIKLPREKIALNSLSLNSFSQEVRNAINKYKQIKDKLLEPPKQVQKTKPDYFVILGSYKIGTTYYQPPNNSYILENLEWGAASDGKGKWHLYVKDPLLWKYSYSKSPHNNYDQQPYWSYVSYTDRFSLNYGSGHVELYIASMLDLSTRLKQYPRSIEKPEFYSWS